MRADIDGYEFHIRNLSKDNSVASARIDYIKTSAPFERTEFKARQLGAFAKLPETNARCIPPIRRKLFQPVDETCLEADSDSHPAIALSMLRRSSSASLNVEDMTG